MCAVTAISRPDGTAASPTQVAASSHVGGAASASAVSAGSGKALRERRSSTPQPAISTISAKNPTDHMVVWSPRRVSGSTTNGYEMSARKLPTLLAAYRKYGSRADG